MWQALTVLRAGLPSTHTHTVDLPKLKLDANSVTLSGISCKGIESRYHSPFHSCNTSRCPAFLSFQLGRTLLHSTMLPSPAKSRAWA